VSGVAEHPRLGERLDRSFYRRDSLEVAPQLLNKVLAHGAVAGRIVEVEAYRGEADRASHAFGGRTARNATMFGPPGHLYVYFTYGMHFCANVVCGEEGEAMAVLLRALAPLAGLEEMRRRRGSTRAAHDLCSGPAKLCQALGIDRRLDGADLVASDGPVALLDDGTPPPEAIAVGPRVGLSRRAGESAALPWRFALRGEPCVSRPAPA